MMSPLLAKKINLRFIFVFFCALGVPIIATAASDMQSMCLGDWAKLSQRMNEGEREHGLGNLETARKHFLFILDASYPLLSAQAAYRLAEIEEQKILIEPRLAMALRSRESALFDTTHLLTGIESVRNAYLRVMSFSNAFWNRRAAFRIITLMDDTISEIRRQLSFPNAKVTVSPFSILFAHIVFDQTLDGQLFALEQERLLLESYLINQSNMAANDPLLYFALADRSADGYAISPSFAERISPPWADALPLGSIIKQKKQYYELKVGGEIAPLNHTKALKKLRELVSDDTNSTSYAFALSYLADEKEYIPEQKLVSAILSKDTTIQLAGLYAAQQQPSHLLTQAILQAWAQTANTTKETILFSTLQRTLFGQRERILFALSAHFSLGRESTRKILASSLLPDEEKAWLLQFRKDKVSFAHAENFLFHTNLIVRARAQHAMRIWKRTFLNG